MFHAALDYYANKNDMPPKDVFREWLVWTGEASNAVVDVFNAIGVHMIEEVFPTKTAQEVEPFVEKDFVDGYNKRPLALFANEIQGKRTS